MTRALRGGPGRIRWRLGLAGAVAGLCAGAALSGCALPVQAEMDQAADVARFATRYDHVVGSEATVVDRALAECPDKTARAETACLRERLGGASTPKALAALVPGCHIGNLCRYEATTRNRRGFVSATATDFVRHWRVEVDLRRPAASVAAVPVTVTDRDDFDTPAPSPSGTKPQG
jgi:hypothetical protein